MELRRRSRWSNQLHPEESAWSPSSTVLQEDPQESEVCYIPLEKEKIRLLELDLSANLQHKLLTNIDPRAGALAYDALSYCWGSSHDRTSIYIDGLTLSISQSLDDALAEVIAYWRRNPLIGPRKTYLWIDQICIDQKNTPEKEEQVAFMEQIYKHANTVLVALSIPRRTLHHAADLNDDDYILWLFGRGLFCSEMDFVDLYNAFHGTQPDATEVGWAWRDILAIVASPWWQRAWVYQELILSSRATFLADGRAMPPGAVQNLLEHYLHLLHILVNAENEHEAVFTEHMQQHFPYSWRFRCCVCQRWKGAEYIWVLLKAQVTWYFIALCYLFLWLLPKETTGHFGYITFITKFVSRAPADLSGVRRAIQSCDCTTEHRYPRVLRLPRLKMWRKSEYAKRWLVSVSRDRFLWLEVVTTVFIWTFFPLISKHILQRERTASNMNPYWMVLHTVLHGVLMRIPVSDINDRAPNDLGTQNTRFASWRGIMHESMDSWTLAATMLVQYSNFHEGVQDLSFSKVIEHARNTRSTDPRDKVYAFLGVLAAAGRRPNIKADYETPNIRMVLTEAAEQLILAERGFGILSFAMEDNASSMDSVHLPTWVPNWSRPRINRSGYRTAREKIMRNSMSQNTWNASKGRKADVTFYTDEVTGKRILRVRAIYIDTLGSSGHLVTPNLYTGRDTGAEILTMASMDNGPATGDEVWLLIGADKPTVFRNNAFVDAFGIAVGDTLSNVIPNRLSIAVGKRFGGRTMYKVICEADVREDYAGFLRSGRINEGFLIDEMDAGRVKAQMIDIC